MKRISLVKEAHGLVKHQIRPGAIAVDATVGNGHDTLFLVEQIGTTGRLFGFDIQQSALDITRARLEQAKLSEGVTLFQANHAVMTEKIPVQYQSKIDAIMFNLGYLPGGDKSVITLADSTLTALNSAGQILSPGGIITILAYPGHDGGGIETAQVRLWCEQLNGEQFAVQILTPMKDNISAPVLFAIYKTA